ncbi:MAG: hypothetical protein AB2L14_34450 [Candidatus Xenobiia bacterium LiM19]
MKNIHINNDFFSGLNVNSTVCRFFSSIRHYFSPEKKLISADFGKQRVREGHEDMDRAVPQRFSREKIVKSILPGLIFVLMIVVMMDLPYAAYPGGATPFIAMISTLMCLSVITLLNL